MSEEKIYGELIWRLVKEGKSELIGEIIKKLKKEGKFYLIKDILNYLDEKCNQEKNIIKGSLKLSFPSEIETIVESLEKELERKIELDKVEIDKKLILGGLFVGKDIKVDFSLKNLISKLLKNLVGKLSFKKEWKT